jgi:hypothetical protein
MRLARSHIKTNTNMEIFRIRLNSNKFQSFLPKDANVWQTDTLKLNCVSKLSTWRSPEVYIHNPKLEKGNFSHLCSGGFVVDALTAKEFRTIFEIAGELLPLTHEEFPFYLVNILECVNCLDTEKTEWVTGKTTGAKIRIKNYQFDKNKLSESTLFKIPETSAAEILCVTGLKDSEDEFKTQVEKAGLKGLIFERLWFDTDLKK